MTRPSAFTTLGVKITAAANLKGSVNFTMNHAVGGHIAPELDVPRGGNV
jgi:hypothetical protein